MSLNSSGPISIAGAVLGQSIALELSKSATAQTSLNDTNVRSLAGIPSGAISLYDFYGKSSVVPVDITSSRTNYVFNPSQVTGYVPGYTTAQLTIGAGVYLYSTDTSSAALTITGFTAGDTVNIVNNGYILGMGGRGGSSRLDTRTVYPGSLISIYDPASVGGPAISIGYDCNIENNGYIAGGGGGGGASIGSGMEQGAGGGGGAGGGHGGDLEYDLFFEYYKLSGGTGGGPGAAGTDAQYALMGDGKTTSGATGGGGGGGRILPGTGGVQPAIVNIWDIAGHGGGAGGSGSSYSDSETTPFLFGGSGGSAGSNGSNGQSGTSTYTPTVYSAGGGGGWGASGGSGGTATGTSGAAGGKAIALNGHTASLTGTGTRYGAVA